MSPGAWIPDISCSPPSSESSFDEDEVNYRVKPYWPKYRSILKHRGFHLETVRDVMDYYKFIGMPKQSERFKGLEEDTLCPDAGLPDNLFRGIRSDGNKVMIKAVHRGSRELDIIRFLCSPAMKHQPMNHCIRESVLSTTLAQRSIFIKAVHDLIDVAEDDIAFIVMEQWSSQLVINDAPCCLQLFLAAIRQCIEHCLFMHMHRIAHLDISLRNLLTDYKGHYAYIDFELSRKFDLSDPRVCGRRGTELPPECGHDTFYNPYKVDVWALGILVLRACKLAGFCVPELIEIVKPMLHEDPSQRPSMESIMSTYDHMISSLSPQRLLVLPHFC
ncbi:kinase-like domain-containing protein [Lentinula aciculospora]|uniref:Kinase-like domain-containing protein n=1 Tax=Lentinula aciculospora TaxID=153920 RepID=A0A9W9DWU9_9AGAR|nr:kinase-like domain-containing protein [Lentinula aciculospora]